MDFGRIITITILVFALMTMIFNFIRAPFQIPGDLYIDKLGFKIYVPVVSTLVISIAITILLSMIQK